MKLFITPATCSLSPHIAFHEAGVPFEIEHVDPATKKTSSGLDFLAINPKGYVPALQLDNGAVLTEAAVVVQYIADLNPKAGLAPAAGTLERYQMHEWLNYIATEVHKFYNLMFNAISTDDVKKVARSAIPKRYDFLASSLGKKPYLMGENFTVADGYLFTSLTWATYAKIDLSPWPVLASYFKRVAARPKVQATLKAEGLSF